VRAALPFVVALALSAGVGLGAAACSSTPSDPTLARGQQVYEANCASCHGDHGQGVNAPRLIGIAATYPDVAKQIAVITNGRSTMPAWQGRLSPEDIAAVAAYTRSLS